MKKSLTMLQHYTRKNYNEKTKLFEKFFFSKCNDSKNHSLVKPNQFFYRQGFDKRLFSSSLILDKNNDHIHNLFFQGGGPKGIAYVGALNELSKYIDPSLSTVKRVAGTSAGAITSTLLAVGYTPDEIQRITYELDTMDFVKQNDKHNELRKNFLITLAQPAILKLIKLPLLLPSLIYLSLRNHGALCDGERFRQWIETKISEKIKANGELKYPYLTFGELKRLVEEKPQVYKHLSVVVNVLRDNPKELSPGSVHSSDPKLGNFADNYIISDSVRMSMSIPILYSPHGIYYQTSDKSSPGESYLKEEQNYQRKRDGSTQKRAWDGGLYKNYYPKYFVNIGADNDSFHHTLGLALQNPKIKLSSLLRGLFTNQAPEKPDDLTVFVNNMWTKLSDFDMSSDTKDRLIDSGANAIQQHSEKYPQKLKPCCTTELAAQDNANSQDGSKRSSGSDPSNNKQYSSSSYYFMGAIFWWLVFTYYRYNKFYKPYQEEVEKQYSVTKSCVNFLPDTDVYKAVEANIKHEISRGRKNIALSGLTGIGKTEIAKYYAKRHKEDHLKYISWSTLCPTFIQIMTQKFSQQPVDITVNKVPPIVLLENSDGNPLEKSYRNFARKLGISSQDKRDINSVIEDVNEAIKTRFSSQCVLIFDNVQSKQTVEPYLSIKEGNKSIVIVTTQNPDFFLHTHQSTTINLDDDSYKEKRWQDAKHILMHAANLKLDKYAEHLLDKVGASPLTAALWGGYIQYRNSKPNAGVTYADCLAEYEAIINKLTGSKRLMKDLVGLSIEKAKIDELVSNLSHKGKDSRLDVNDSIQTMTLSPRDYSILSVLHGLSKCDKPSAEAVFDLLMCVALLGTRNIPAQLLEKIAKLTSGNKDAIAVAKSLSLLNVSEACGFGADKSYFIHDAIKKLFNKLVTKDITTQKKYLNTVFKCFADCKIFSNDNTTVNKTKTNRTMFPHVNIALRYLDEADDIQNDNMDVLITKVNHAYLLKEASKALEAKEAFKTLKERIDKQWDLTNYKPDNIYLALKNANSQLPLIYAAILHGLGHTYFNIRNADKATQHNLFNTCVELCRIIREKEGKALLYELLAQRSGLCRLTYDKLKLEKQFDKDKQQQLLDIKSQLKGLRYDKWRIDHQGIKYDFSNDDFNFISCTSRVAEINGLLAQHSDSSSDKKDYYAGAQEAFENICKQFSQIAKKDIFILREAKYLHRYASFLLKPETEYFNKAKAIKLLKRGCKLEGLDDIEAFETKETVALNDYPNLRKEKPLADVCLLLAKIYHNEGAGNLKNQRKAHNYIILSRLIRSYCFLSNAATNKLETTIRDRTKRLSTEHLGQSRWDRFFSNSKEEKIMETKTKEPSAQGSQSPNPKP